MTIIPAASLIDVPWKNGGGITREIAAGPPGASLDAFAWRLSIADVSSDGAFSVFPGVDRVLVLLDGVGMRLAEAGGREHRLDQPLAMARFAGETPISASLINGPTRDFNVMVRRDRARTSVCVRRAGRHELARAHELTFVYCARGRVSIACADGSRAVLDVGDTVRVEQPCAVEATSDAAWLVIGIEEIRA
ncbi:HutD family protein [Caballeronia sp. LZ062]|uniref:HutD/Ves family protein n=1 Tax=unclassified Caballeronia TaxID=2646786 RepID=UPI00285D18E2|nr:MULTISPECIES: HutD family protein [unclassified Caballeronia]MDR5856762.1 HutD family protein [Caballeronia sp. LZ050]MDR5869841.1 HutD family protein [Caballeronia sp. LZ062]